MKKYNHALDIAFEVYSDDEHNPTNEEILDGLQTRIDYLRLHRKEIKDATAIIDTIENQ